MRIASRTSNLLLIALLGFALIPAASAERRGHVDDPDRVMRGGAKATPGEVERESEQRRTDAAQNGHETIGVDGREQRLEHPAAAARRAVEEPGGVVAPYARTAARRNGCRYEAGRVRVGGCDYYYDDAADRYYDYEGEAMPGWSPDQPWPAGATASQPTTSDDSSPGAATLAPAAGPEDYGRSYSVEGSDELREKLIAGRKNWMQKKAVLDDANTAVARAEYQQEQTGRPVDPGLIASQKRANQEAHAAFEALEPLVQEARDAGMSPRVLELYEEMNMGE